MCLISSALGVRLGIQSGSIGKTKAGRLNPSHPTDRIR